MKAKWLFQPPRDLSRPLRWLESPPANLADTPEKRDAGMLGGLMLLGSVALLVLTLFLALLALLG